MIPTLLHHLIDISAKRSPNSTALKCRGHAMTYLELADLQAKFAGALVGCGVARGSRVGVLLSKSFEFVGSVFGASRAGATFVPINPILKPAQIGHILRDCSARVLVVSGDRYRLLKDELGQCPAIERVVVVGDFIDDKDESRSWSTLAWSDFVESARFSGWSTSDNDVASILYTSGSTGKPKGVVLSHRNMVSGAISVASYLQNRSDDRLLAVLPFSFDAGFSQLTTAFHVGACAVLLDYLLPNEVVRMLREERITGLTAVPPLYAQLTEQNWPDGIDGHLRYFATTGGRMPREILSRLRTRVPSATPYLMYGLTEAFRSTYLPPEQVDLRPDSIGIAIPNQEVLVLNGEGRPCAPNEPGELVHRGSTVGLGYWNDPDRTAERFRPLPSSFSEGTVPETAVFSGDIVYKDADGYLYFVGRRDDMIKSSGYRISPTEIEEVAYDSGLLAEAAAIGLEHPKLGQAVVLVAVPSSETGVDEDSLTRLFRAKLPPYMVPVRIQLREEPLPRNPNGKIDRRVLVETFSDLFAEISA